MKKSLLILVLFVGIGSANSQIVNIPDANFKAYLVSIPSVNTNMDTEIQVSEAAAYSGQINCSSLGITDLTGIEEFSSMTSLWCTDNQLTSLDVSSCTALVSLTCSNNQLTNLNYNNGLKYLFCENNELTTLDFSANAGLEQLMCGWNLLTSLDLSGNSLLSALGCQNSQLTTLNVANGNNSNMISFWAFGNPSLTCIEVDNAYWSSTNWFNIDAQTTFSLDCNGSFGCTVTIPDANFKAYLVGNTAINTNMDTEIQCSEASAYNSQIFVQALGIQDLTGLEAFTALTSLNCNSNLLTSLDISANSALEVLNFAGNQISAIDVSNNLQLLGLYCDYNQLTTIDVSANVNLIELSINNNIISQLDISANSNLIELGCESNTLTDLNAANGNNINFTAFYATGNPNLTCIEVDDATYSTTNWTNIDATASFSEDCAGTAAIQESEVVSMSIYPNPASSTLTIETEAFIESIQILNVNGTLVQTETTDKFSVALLSDGIYIINVKTAEGLMTKRFVKK